MDLRDDVLRYVANEPSAAMIWSKLEALYMSKSLSKKLFLIQFFYTFKMIEGMSIQDHLNEFNKIINNLKNVDE